MSDPFAWRNAQGVLKHIAPGVPTEDLRREMLSDDRITASDLQPDNPTPRSTALRCGACGAPLDTGHRCEFCNVEVCPDCGCCPCICIEVER